MNINSVGASKMVKIYGKNNSVAKNEKMKEKNSNDSIEISSVGKSLSCYSIDEKFTASSDRIEKIKEQIEKGTYKVDSKLIAKGILDHIKSLK